MREFCEKAFARLDLDYRDFVEIDPRYWDAEMDVQVNVALGRGTDHDKMQFLMLVAQKQEQIMQLLGPSNPLADVVQYRNTLAQICALAGFKDADRYFKPVNDQAMQQLAAAKPQQPDPTMVLAQVEAQKVQASIQGDQLRIQSPSRDELQDVMRLLREKDFGVALQFGNYR